MRKIKAFPKHPRQDKEYLGWLRTQKCCYQYCPGGGGDIIPAHMRILGNAGTGIKPPDRDALPLCFWCHAQEHAGTISFWGQETKAKTKEYVQRLCDEHLLKYEEVI